MTIDQLKALVGEYLATLDADHCEEYFMSARDYADVELSGFIAWLKKRPTHDSGPSITPAEAIAAQREYAGQHLVTVPTVPVPSTIEEATRFLEAAGFKVQR
jgi:hypothetical protein